MPPARGKALRARHLVIGTSALTLALASSSSITVAQAPSEARARLLASTQCRPSERVLYSCRFARGLGSVCASHGTIRYRFGPPGRPAIELASAPDWTNIFVGWVVGQGGGHQTHVRFARGDYHYLVFEGVDGELADRPGRRYSGIYVGAGPDGRRELGYHHCRRQPILLGRWHEMLNDNAPPAVRERGVQEEEPGGPFDAWF